MRSVAYWWVNQGKTWKRELPGGFIWAPFIDRGGKTPFHWASMAEVRAGDVIFSYVDRTFPAVGTALGPAYESTNPGGDFAEWETRGRRVDVEWRQLDAAASIEPCVTELLAVMPAKRAPL